MALAVERFEMQVLPRFAELRSALAAVDAECRVVEPPPSARRGSDVRRRIVLAAGGAVAVTLDALAPMARPPLLEVFAPAERARAVRERAGRNRWRAGAEPSELPAVLAAVCIFPLAV